jgi:hypothetical protein
MTLLYIIWVITILGGFGVWASFKIAAWAEQRVREEEEKQQGLEKREWYQAEIENWYYGWVIFAIVVLAANLLGVAATAAFYLIT